MSRVLITGADGFTGRYLARALHEAGHEVHGLVKRTSRDGVLSVSACHVADLSDGQALADVVSRVQPDKVAHLAAIAFVGHGDATAMYNTNLVGTRNLLEVLAASKSPLTTVLLASSANIYGNAVMGCLDEQTPPAPANDYAVSKLAMEYMASLYAQRLPLVVVRPFNYTGIGQADTFLIPKIVLSVRRLAKVLELGKLDVARDFSDVRSVVQIYERLLGTPEAVGQTFNVCSGTAWTLTEVIQMVKEISGHDFEVQMNPAFVRPNEVKTLLGNRSRLDAVVGTVAEIPLRDTLRWMLEA